MRYPAFFARGCIALCALSATSLAGAQSAPPKPATEEAEAVELNPFVVNSTSDTGYLASNTLAGSRMNTELRNVASVVSVFTPEFIADLGATSIDDLLEYGLNTQVDLGAGDFNHQGDQNSVADGLGTQRNFRVRGQGASVALDYFGGAGPLDTYNLERVELSSGPNAILFGTGASGGLINMSVRRPNMARVSLENKLVLGSFAERRFTTDLNLPVVKNKVAFRMQALHAKEEGFQRLGYKNTDRGTFSAIVRPTKTTEIIASLEHGYVDQSKNSVASSAVDSLSAWLARRAALGGAGPLTTRTQALALGAPQALAQYGVAEVNRHRYTVVTNDGFTANFRQVVESRSTLNNDPRAALPPEVMPGNINYWGPSAQQENRFRSLTVKLDQKITRDLFAQLSFFDSKTDAGAEFPPLEDALYVDANAVLPNENGTPGTQPNPYGGRLYMEENWVYRTHNEKERVYRATLAYQFAARKRSWLGKHRIAGLVERKETAVTEDNFLEVWDIWSAVPQAARAAYTTNYGFNFTNPEAANNRLWRRNYLTEGNYDTYYAGDSNVFAQTRVGGYTLRPKYVTASAAQEQLLLTTKSRMVALQSAVWRDRLHFTFGHRVETVDGNQAIGARDTSDTINQGNPWRRSFENTRPRTFESTTRSFGVVYHVVPWASVFYNNSSNANSPNLRRNVLPFGTMGPPKHGEGDDVGFAVEFFDRKLYFRAARFTNRSENGDGTFEVAADLITPNAALWDHIEMLQNQAVASGRLPANHPSFVTGSTLESYRVQGVDGDVFDETSEGYELQLVGNPTPQWRVSLNYGYSERRRTNVLKFALDYERTVRAAAEQWEKDHLAALGQTGPLLLGQSFGNTIAETYDRIESAMNETKSAQEDFAFGSRPHKVNLFTTYRFNQGWARGLRVGGGLIYQSPVVTGRFFYYRNSASGVPTVRVQPYNAFLNPTQVLERVEQIDGDALWRVDLTLGYSRRLALLGQRNMLSVQLNVKDLFEQQEQSARRYRPVGGTGDRVITRYNVFPPRTWRLTVGMDF